MGLSNIEIRRKQDTTIPRTPDDVLRRTAKSIKTTQEEVREINYDVSDKVSASEIIQTINRSTEVSTINTNKLDLTGIATESYVNTAIASAITDALSGYY